MKEMGYNDEILNVFKLTIYKWNINDAINHYENDSFCHLYCICNNDDYYGCPNNDQKCKFRHSFYLDHLIHGTKNTPPNFELAQVLCQYLIYLNKYDNNPILFFWYAMNLGLTDTQEDCIFAEKLYLKSISINDKIDSVHSSYAILLQVLENFEKAQYHLKMAVTLNPNNVTTNYNLGLFLMKLGKFRESLQYFETARVLGPSHWWGHYYYAQALYNLNEYSQAIKEFEMALDVNNKLSNDNINEIMPEEYVSKAKDYILKMKTSLKDELKELTIIQETVCIKFLSCDLI